jgi:hypothetical protein
MLTVRYWLGKVTRFYFFKAIVGASGEIQVRMSVADGTSEDTNGFEPIKRLKEPASSEVPAGELDDRTVRYFGRDFGFYLGAPRNGCRGYVHFFRNEFSSGGRRSVGRF